MTREEFLNLKEGDEVTIDAGIYTWPALEPKYIVDWTSFNSYDGAQVALVNKITNAVIIKKEDDHPQISLIRKAAVQNDDGECIFHNLKRYVGFTDIYDYCTRCGFKSEHKH